MKTIKRKYLFISIVFIASFCQNPKENDFPLSIILSRKVLINNYCKIFNLNPRLYISVIYGELINNYNALDNFDETRAYLGFDASIGFAQLRISTIKWIELNYSDLPFISQSSSRKELIEKGLNDTTNVIYSVLYVKLIKEKLSKIYSVRSIGSYYGIGIDKQQKIDKNYTNAIGDSAMAFYFSDRLIKIFDRKD